VSNLPNICYVKNEETGATVLVRANVRGYFDVTRHVDPKSSADDLNAMIGVTKAQAAAMKVGSMFGFHVPGANPANYDEAGRPK
jgi:rare lipoprotein A (peptidoglycan hydrolase)